MNRVTAPAARAGFLLRAAAIFVFTSAFFAGSFAAADPVADARLVRSGPSSVTFEVNVPEARIARDTRGDGVLIPGYGTFSPPGAPELPGRTFSVAVPRGSAVRISWAVSASDDLGPLQLRRVPAERFIGREDGIPLSEPFVPPDPWNGDVPLETVTAGEAALMGRQTVVPVRVCPLSRSGDGYLLARKISVTLDFGAAAPAEETRAGRLPPSRLWQGLYERVLVNPGDVERFSLDPRRPAALRAPAQQGKRFKIRIPETGLYSIRADSLIAAGLSPSLADDGFALKKLYYDAGRPGLERAVEIPYRVLKGVSSAPAVFGADDRLIFHARGVKDDPDAGDTVATYNTYNVIWLFEEQAGALMPDGPPFPSAAGLPAPPFRHEVRIRRDTYYHKYVPAGVVDFYYVRGPERDEAAVAFPVRGLLPSSTVSVHARIRGDVRRNPGQDLEFFIRNSSGTRLIGAGQVNSTNEQVFDIGGVPSGWFVEGDNQLVVRSEEQYGFLINDLTVKYQRVFAAHADLLEFVLEPALAPRRVEIAGFSAPAGYLVEITDPGSPVFFAVPPDSFHAVGGVFTLRLTLPAVAERRFVAAGAGAGGHIYKAWVKQDKPSDIRGLPGPFNTIVAAHADFLPPASGHLAQYVAYREQQGYRVLLVDVEDVYDEFNGGLFSSAAVRRLARYGVETWGAEFLLLVGDSNEDHRRIHIGDPPETRGSPPDFVPAYTYSVRVIGRDRDEVVASDKYYVFLDEPPPGGLGSPAAQPEAQGGEVPPEMRADADAPDTRGDEAPRFAYPASAYPDLIVGRLPVGREIELRALLTKMYRFESPSAGDAWRRRVVLFADDAWSGAFADYSFRSNELHFEYGMDSVAAAIERALPGGFDIQRLFLSRWTDGVTGKPGGGSQVLYEAIDSTRRYFTPHLIRRLNEGCLFYSFQGHASRAHLTTESAFSNFNQYKDVDSLRTDRNHIFMGFGCHISDFAIVRELNLAAFQGPGGDCLAEQLLFKSRSGAVGTYASTGFEYLFENKELCTTMHETIFRSPPLDSVPPLREYTGARWILGEAFTAGELVHLGRVPYAYEQIYRYVLLGDPMLRVDPGPPLMRLEADWGSGWEPLAADTLRARDRSNACRLRFSASDVVALGGVAFEVDGEDRTADLAVTPLRDEDLTYARGYAAEVDHTISLDDRSLVFRALSVAGGAAGFKQIAVDVSLRLYNGPLHVPAGGESPATGEFRLEIGFPVWLAEPPVVLLDLERLDDRDVSAPSAQDSTRWRARFTRGDDNRLAAGPHALTVRVGDYETHYPFNVAGSGLVVEAFNVPNPFTTGTNICFMLNLPADAGSIMIFNVSGALVREFRLPRQSLGYAGIGAPNAVWWDGRDSAGDRVANGTYLYRVEIEKDAAAASVVGKAVKLE